MTCPALLLCWWGNAKSFWKLGYHTSCPGRSVVSCGRWLPSRKALKVAAREGQACSGGSSSAFIYAMLTAGSPAATTQLKASAAARHRFSEGQLKRVTMQPPRPATTCANVSARACHGAWSLHQISSPITSASFYGFRLIWLYTACMLVCLYGH